MKKYKAKYEFVCNFCGRSFVKSEKVPLCRILCKKCNGYAYTDYCEVLFVEVPETTMRRTNIETTEIGLGINRHSYNRRANFHGAFQFS